MQDIMLFRRVAWVHGHTFHPAYLAQGGWLLDLGANVGGFSRRMTETYGLRSIAVEPMRELCAQIPGSDRITVVEAAVSSTSGTARIIAADNPLGASLETGDAETSTVGIQVETISIQDLDSRYLPDEAEIDLMKLDIEGAELAALDHCPDDLLRRCKQLTFEFHDFKNMYDSGEVRVRLRRLESLGFRCLRMSRIGHHDVWCVNRDKCNISGVEFNYIAWCVRPTVGVARIIRRRLDGSP